MTEHSELYKRFLYQLLEQMLLLIIVLFIFMGIYIPIKSISQQIKNNKDIIRIAAPKGMPIYINGEKRYSSIELIWENGELKTKDKKLPVRIKKRSNGSYDIEIKKQP